MLALQTNTHLEQFQLLMNSEQRKKCTAYFVDFDRRVVFQNEIKFDALNIACNMNSSLCSF